MVEAAHLLHAFVDFAATLAATARPVDAAVELVQRVDDVFDVDAATVFLVQPDGSLHAVAWSGDPARRAASLELEHAEGPGHDAVRSGEPVVARDRDDARQRWPEFAPAAAHAGLESFAAVPMRSRAAAVGSLAVGAGRAEAVAPADVAVVQGLADLGTLAITDARAARTARAVAAQLQTALDARVVIEQAKGVVAERAGVSVDDAFTALRRYARGRHQLLTDVARRVVEGTLDPETVVRPTR
jgi:transcriptional regulator with GAF, ATPase, and Fis domain